MSRGECCGLTLAKRGVGFANVVVMSNTVEIHKGKTPKRFHFIPEWAEHRGMKQADISREGNFDKGLVSRWWQGVVPTPNNLAILAAMLTDDDISSLFRDPYDDWLAKLFRDKTEKQKELALNVLISMFPDEAVMHALETGDRTGLTREQSELLDLRNRIVHGSPVSQAGKNREADSVHAPRKARQKAS
jgi:transcriptional regulator with XRE-family HTH domain